MSRKVNTGTTLLPTTTSIDEVATFRIGLHSTIPVFLSLCVAVLNQSACSSPDTTPAEQQIRTLVEKAEALAEAGDAAGFGELVSEDYRDGRANSKQSLMLLLNYYLSANRSVHLLTRTTHIRFPDPASAEFLVFVAMAGSPIPDAESLGALRADLYHFVVDAKLEEGEWRIRRARWDRGWEVEGISTELGKGASGK